MAKKKTVSKIESPKKFSNEEIQAGLDISASEYFINVASLTSHREDAELLNFTKVPVSTPDGGIYLVCIMHVDGPRLNLKNLAKAAEEQGK